MLDIPFIKFSPIQKASKRKYFEWPTTMTTFLDIIHTLGLKIGHTFQIVVLLHWRCMYTFEPMCKSLRGKNHYFCDPRITPTFQNITHFFSTFSFFRRMSSELKIFKHQLWKSKISFSLKYIWPQLPIKLLLPNQTVCC